MKLEIDFEFHADDPSDPQTGPELEVNYLAIDGRRLPMTIHDMILARRLILEVRRHLIIRGEMPAKIQ